MTSIRLWIKEWLYTKCPGFSGSFPYLGTKVYFPESSLIFKMACKEGIYEQINVNLLQTLVKPNSFYFDIGANIGLMAVPVLKHVDSCQVISFEPAPSVLPFIKRTVENSSYSNRWVVSGKALGSQIGKSYFFTSSSGMDAYSGFRDTNRSDTQTKVEVPVTTIDAEWKNLGNPDISVIKVDVEGAELQVLAGAKECIEREKPFILLEWNTKNIGVYHATYDQLIEVANTINYRIFSVFGNHSTYLPFNLIPIQDSLTLQLHMLSTESFLLTPSF